MIGLVISFHQTLGWGHCHQSFSFGRQVIEGRGRGRDDRGWVHQVIVNRLIVDQDLRWSVRDL